MQILKIRLKALVKLQALRALLKRKEREKEPADARKEEDREIQRRREEQLRPVGPQTFHLPLGITAAPKKAYS